MKTPIIAIIALAALSLGSCKREYTCECKKIRTDENGNTSTTSDGVYTFKDSQPRAETKCNEQEGSGTDLGGEYTRECQIQ